MVHLMELSLYIENFDMLNGPIKLHFTSKINLSINENKKYKFFYIVIKGIKVIFTNYTITLYAFINHEEKSVNCLNLLYIV